MACTLAESPGDPFHRKLRQLRCLHRRFDCYRVERTSSRAGVSPAEVQRLFTAHFFANQPPTNRRFDSLRSTTESLANNSGTARSRAPSNRHTALRWAYSLAFNCIGFGDESPGLDFRQWRYDFSSSS